MSEFVQENLSNWYVRLNRRRFWKSEMGRDKLAAYQTAHECLITICKLIAPVSPFHAEQLYRDLTSRSPELASVHLTDFPTPDAALINDSLNQQMRATRRAASLALSLRKDKGIKVRQPLSRLTIITEPRLGEALPAEAQGVVARLPLRRALRAARVLVRAPVGDRHAWHRREVVGLR